MAIKKFFTLLLAVIVVVSIFTPGYLKIAKLKQKNFQLIQRIENLELTKQNLENEIRLLEEDAEYLEKLAREKLGLTKEGEIIYKIEE